MMKKNALLIQLMLIIALFNAPLTHASKSSINEIDQDVSIRNIASQSINQSCKRCNSCMQGHGYSREGDCLECERKHYPTRFQGCPSCRQPQKESGFCQSCRFGFKDWISQTLVKSNNDSAIQSDHEYFQKLYLWMAADKIMRNHKPVAYIEDSAATFIRNNTDSKKIWIGFYIGNFEGQHLWTNYSNILPKHIKKITYNTAESYLKYIMQEYGLLNFDTSPIIDGRNDIKGMRAMKK